MLRNVLVAVCSPTLLVACTHGVATPAQPPKHLQTSHFVEAIVDFEKQHDVPPAFQHLVDWHAGQGSVVLLLAQNGHLACAVTPVEAAKVLIHHPYRCRWSSPR